MIEKADLFEDISLAMESWVDVLVEALSTESPDLPWAEDRAPYDRIARALKAGHVDSPDVRSVATECLRGFAVSLLTSLDGGSASAAKGRMRLIDDQGRPLGEGLHDDFVGYLLDTGRL